MSNATGTNRPKPTGETVGETMPSTNSYETILKLALPFLTVDDLFPGMNLVSFDTHEQCMELLYQHCQEHHPTLALMDEGHVKNQEELNRETYIGWLTYRRYKYFELKRRDVQMFGDDDPLEDYELILDLSTFDDSEKKPLLLVHDIEPIWPSYGGHLGCTFRTNNFPCPNKDMREGDVSKLRYRVRVMVREKSTGKFVVVLDDKWSHSPRRKADDDNDADDSSGPKYEFWYSDNGLTFQDDGLCSSVRPHVYFTRYRTSSGEVAFVESDYEGIEFLFVPGDGRYTDRDDTEDHIHKWALLQVMSGWEWF